MHATRTLLVVVAALGLTACGAHQPTGPAEPAGLDCPQLGIRLAAVPAAFEVVRNQGDELVLEPADEGTTGRLTVRAEAPEVGGVNVVAAVGAHQERIESLPDGAYLGQQELVTPGGTAFWSRGAYTEDVGLTEETAVFGVHPDGQHLLVLTYTYPRRDDSAARVERLLEVLGEIELLTR